MSTEGFSWKAIKKEAIRIKIERAMTMAKHKNVNPDFAIQHPEWVREAQNNNYTDLKKKVTEVIERQQAQAQARRDKIAKQ